MTCITIPLRPHILLHKASSLSTVADPFRLKLSPIIRRRHPLAIAIGPGLELQRTAVTILRDPWLGNWHTRYSVSVTGAPNDALIQSVSTTRSILLVPSHRSVKVANLRGMPPLARSE